MSLAFENPLIYVITRGDATDSNFAAERVSILDVIRLAVDEGVDLVQIREKRLCGRYLYDLTAAAAAITSSTATRLLVNDRADIAAAAMADGVHLSADSIPVNVIRSAFPSGFIIGVSTHSVEEVLKASEDNADFSVFGPVFRTPGKERACGPGSLTQICRAAKPFPVIALGGVDGSNMKEALDAGARGIAGIRSFNDPESLRRIARNIKYD